MYACVCVCIVKNEWFVNLREEGLNPGVFYLILLLLLVCVRAEPDPLADLKAASGFWLLHDIIIK